MKTATQRILLSMISLCLMWSVFRPVHWVLVLENNGGKPDFIKVDNGKILPDKDLLDKLEQGVLDRLEHEAYLESLKITKTVYMTNYYIGDGSSGQTTASGKKISQFKVNEMGWYTYNGMVVVAAATNYCIRMKTGVCGNWNSLPAGWVAFDFYDEITIIYQGKSYRGVVLDLCGACSYKVNNEKYQRIDVFVHHNPFGKVLAEIKFTKDE